MSCHDSFYFMRFKNCFQVSVLSEDLFARAKDEVQQVLHRVAARQHKSFTSLFDSFRSFQDGEMELARGPNPKPPFAWQPSQEYAAWAVCFHSISFNFTLNFPEMISEEKEFQAGS